MLILKKNLKELNLNLRELGFLVKKEYVEDTVLLIKEIAMKEVHKIVQEYGNEIFFDSKKVKDFILDIQKVVFFEKFDTYLCTKPRIITGSWIEEHKERILNEINAYGWLEEEELTAREIKSLKKVFSFNFLILRYSFIEDKEILYLAKSSENRSSVHSYKYVNQLLFDFCKRGFASNSWFLSDNSPKENIQNRRYKDIFTRALKLGYFTPEFRKDFYKEYIKVTEQYLEDRKNKKQNAYGVYLTLEMVKYFFNAFEMKVFGQNAIQV